MVRKMLLLIMLSFLLAMGGLWALQAQKPAVPAPPPPQKPTTMKTEPQVTTATATQGIDLSGTYTGTFNCEAAGLVGDTTLTINGNEFTTADGRTGRITTSKTKGYTAVALQVNGADASAAPTTVSLRAKKSGNRLTLTPVAGATQKCTFVPGKSVAKGRTTKMPAATGTEVANPSAVPVESPIPVQTPSPSPTPSGSPTPSPSPEEPVPSPTPSPSPSPSPRM